MTKYSALTTILITAFFLNPVFSSAQNVADTINITTSPSSPAAGQTVMASVDALEFNINLANIVWSLDGKVMKSGQGEKTFAFKAPLAGKSTNLSVTVTPPGKSPISRNVDISVGGSMDIIWEAVDGYTPPFYRGKTLPIKQSAIKVVAMPNVKSSNGIPLKASTFAYTWRKDGSNVMGQSGLGKNSMVFINQILEQTNRVEVSATNGLETINSSIIVAPFTPDILFYEYDQLTLSPKYQKAFAASNTIAQPRMTLVAEPYFLARDWKTNNGVVLDWNINGQVAKAIEKNQIGIITTNSTSDITVEYNEAQKLFRNFREGIKIIAK